MNTPDSKFPGEDNSIEATAAMWLAEREDGFNAAQIREFEQWRGRDPRHAAAVERLERTCGLLRKLPLARAELTAGAALDTDSGFQPAMMERAAGAGRRSPAAHPRGTFRFVALGMAATLAFAALAWWQWPAPVPEPTGFATTFGGYQRVTLTDGSILELNADSRAQVHLSADQRRVTLTDGEAHFHVARDAARPFIVRAGAVSVRAVGTAFNVRLGTAEVEVLVTEGRVVVAAEEGGGQRMVGKGRRSEGGGQKAEVVGQGSEIGEQRQEGRGPRSEDGMANRFQELAAGQRVIIPTAVTVAGPVVEAVAPDEIRRSLAWQERKLVFVETPLREVAEQFNRRNRLQLVISDPTMGERTVGGTFVADNVETFVRLLEESGDIAAEHRSQWEIVLRKTR